MQDSLNKEGPGGASTGDSTAAGTLAAGRLPPVADKLALAAEIAARHQAVIESTDDAIITTTVAGVITSWNPGAENVFGYPAGEAIGRPILLIVPPDRTH